tara:strand:+ start:144 stop:632 length:489 start_codon:yes stop_codon:yes gene_type:complete
MKKKKIKLGKITSSHGIRGLFKLFPYNNFEGLLSYKDNLKVKNKKIDINKKFVKGNRIICQSSLFASKDSLDDFIGEEIWIEESEVIEKNLDEYFEKDLINCELYDAKGSKIGKVKAIFDFGAGTLLELDSKLNFMIRFYDLERKNIDIKKKIIYLGKDYDL